jgi:hypothetical protein
MDVYLQQDNLAAQKKSVSVSMPNSGAVHLGETQESTPYEWDDDHLGSDCELSEGKSAVSRTNGTGWVTQVAKGW